jgi:Protein kinase domain
MQEGLPATEVWTKWTGQLIDGLFPLESCIGNSDHSGVFLTENPARNASKAALKLVPALPTFAERQLAQWNSGVGLSHPHLIRLLHAGRCQLAENQYLYVVMEYADQNLADLLLRRALTREEAWELLLPTVDALAFLHRRHWVHGHLKPSNILVVGDTVKLSSDTIRTANEAARSNGRSSVYDPPEASGGTAGDIWALGATLAEGLTLAHPSGPVEPGEEPVLPRDFPPTFADAVRRCLSYEPTERPSVADLKGWMTLAAQQPIDSTLAAEDVAPVRKSAVRQAQERPAVQGSPDNAAPKQSLPTRRLLAFLIAGSVVILLVCWAAMSVFSGPGPNPTAAVTPAPVAPPAQPVALAPEAAPGPADTPDPIEEIKEPSQTASAVPNTDAAAVKAVASLSVLHKEIPKVPRAARETIQEDVAVIVRVSVDSSGTVVHEVLADPGSSTYFAQLAINAVRNWKFTQAQDQPSRQWLVRFAFSRDGTTAHEIPLRLKRTAMSH